MGSCLSKKEAPTAGASAALQSNIKKTEAPQEANGSIDAKTTAPAKIVGKKKMDLSKAGISFNFLMKFVASNPETEQWTMNEVCNEVIKKQSNGVSLAESLWSNDETKACVKPVADYFVSYCWRYKYSSLIESLNRFQVEDKGGQDFFVWIDAFIVNQHTSATVDQAQWIKTFGESLKDIGKALIVIVDWNELAYVTRAWCVFEMFTMVSHDIKSKVLISKSEEDDLKRAMSKYGITFGFVETYLSKINIERSQAAKPEDKAMILDSISRTTNGIKKVNDVILNEMKAWLLSMARKFIHEAEDPNSKETRSFYYALYNVHSALKEFPDSLKAAEDLLRVSRVAYGDVSFEVGVSLVNIGTALDELGRHEESLKRCEQALAVYRQVLTPNHSEIGVLLGNMGLTLKSLERYPEALAKYEEALKIKSAVNPESTSVATTLSTIGVIHNIMGNTNKALEHQQEVLRMRVKLLGEDHASVGITHNNLAHVYMKLGNKAEMKVHGEKAYSITKRIYGEDSSMAKDMQHWVA